jgi:hypothetical protein
VIVSGGPDHLAQRRENACPVVAQAADQFRGALHVSEHERDFATGKSSNVTAARR